MSYFLTIEENGLLIKRKSSAKGKQLKIGYEFKIVQASVRQDSSFTAETFHAILGIKVVKNIPFFVVVKQHEPICVFQGAQIYQIKSIDWIPITKQTSKLESSEIQQELKNISKIFEQGLHYYSDAYQLWKPFVLNHIQNTESELLYYQQFVWNSTIINIDIQSDYMSSLYGGNNKTNGLSYAVQKEIFSRWCTPIIQGYVHLFETILPDNFKLQFMLVSRRSFKKAGTRFFSRGIDDNGNVANYTQSEFIVQYNDLVMTNIQIRGSVPVFFEQIGMEGINIELNIQRTKELTKKPFTNHFKPILEHYHRCLCVNLLSQHKKSQLKLSQFYEDMISTTKPYLSEVRYEFFDFHEECKNNEFHNTEKLIIKILGVIKVYGFTCFNLSSGKVVKKQSGVFRTNCLDCLDRTNYVQSRIALQTLKEMLKEFGSLTLKTEVNERGLLKHVDFELNSELLNYFNLLWAQNGDSVSLHYTGIGSTHTDITKVGKRTIFGTVNHKMRSLMRFYTQFTDVKKHQTINTFLGHKSILNFPDWDGNHRSQRKTKEENILVMSWQFTDPERALNEFEKNPYNNKTYQFLLSQLKQKMGNKHSMIVIFMYVPNQMINWQSGINFDIKNFLNPFKSSYTEIINKCSDFVTTQLQSGKHRYVQIDSNVDSFSKMMVFAKKQLVDFITNIKRDQITSSMKTKESVLLTKFKFYESPLVFQGFNVKNIGSFGDFVQKVSEKGFKQTILGRSKSTSVNEQSYRLILGNVGSQSTLSEEDYNNLQTQLEKQMNEMKEKNPNKSTLSSTQVLKLINKGCEHDQLKKFLQSSQLNKQKIKILANYNQAPLQFIPSNNRILFWNEEGKIVRARTYGKITQTNYEKINKDKEKYSMKVANNFNNDDNPFVDEPKGIYMCYPMFNQEKENKQKEAESCVYLELSYEIETMET